MIVEFSIVPLGRGASVGSDVAKVLEIIDNSGLPYRVNPMGTVVEGSWDDIMGLIKKCHRAVMRGGERVITTIKIDDRRGRNNMIDGKIRSLERRLSRTLRK